MQRHFMMPDRISFVESFAIIELGLSPPSMERGIHSLDWAISETIKGRSPLDYVMPCHFCLSNQEVGAKVAYATCPVQFPDDGINIQFRDNTALDELVVNFLRFKRVVVRLGREQCIVYVSQCEECSHIYTAIADKITLSP